MEEAIAAENKTPKKKKACSAVFLRLSSGPLSACF
jgi:hypothetical protein